MINFWLEAFWHRIHITGFINGIFSVRWFYIWYVLLFSERNTFGGKEDGSYENWLFSSIFANSGRTPVYWCITKTGQTFSFSFLSSIRSKWKVWDLVRIDKVNVCLFSTNVNLPITVSKLLFLVKTESSWPSQSDWCVFTFDWFGYVSIKHTSYLLWHLYPLITHTFSFW
jgi:hypothetical protein